MPESYSIILSGGTPGDVAPAMSQLFGIDQKLAGQIAGASPIVLVEDLNEDQAGGVRTALNELVSAGAEITLKAGSVGSIPKVGWGGVPKIAGRLATDYTAPAPEPAPGIVSAPGTFCCPECGASFSLVREGAATPGAAAVPASAPVPAAKPAAPMGPRDSGFEEIPLPDALKALESPPDLPDVPEVPSAAPAKQGTAAPVGGAIPASQVKPGHSSPMALEDFEAGLASDDNLLADLDDGLPDVPDEPAKPVAAKRPAKKPLVEVTGLDDIEVMPLGGAAKAPPAAKPAAPKAKPAKKAKPAPAAKSEAPAGDDAGGDPNQKVNIFANKNNSPKMVELLSKIRGVSPEEAEELASKPLVTVARNISRKQAEVIKKKFLQNRISVRLSPARASQRMKPAE